MDFIKTSAKAICGAIAAAVVVYLAKKGLVVDTSVQTALETVLSGLVVGGVVWITKNKQK